MRSPRRAGGFPGMKLNACVSEDPLFGLTRDGEQGLKVIETERGPITPRARLVFEWPREGHCEERIVLAAILPDRGALMLPHRSV